MPPVGNDIVDLADPENIGKSGDERFCRRLFNANERSLIAAGSVARPDSLLWALWAAKEAAYKAISRDDPSVCSIPRKYPVVIETAPLPGTSPCLEGRVITPRGELPVHIFIAEEMLHAVASGSPEGLAGIFSRVERVDTAAHADPSTLVRQILLEEIARRLGCPPEDLSVVKEQRGSGAPSVFFHGSRLPVEISLSHDGRFVAFAFDPATL